MARSIPRVSDGVLVYHVGPRVETARVGGDAWRAWLEDATSFRVDDPRGSYTARKEPRPRGGPYWYAYRRQGGRLRKGYLGRSDELTLQRLDEAAARLGDGGSALGSGPGPGGAVRPPADEPSEMPATSSPDDALLATKMFMSPPRHNLVRRPRLTERLSAGLRGPLTLIVAPAGWGKTTVLGDWRTAQRDAARPIAWLALDAGDNDLARFLRYVVAALQTLRADAGRSALASLRSPQPPPVEALLTLLINDLAAVSDDVVLVLDDYHLIEDPKIHRAMAFLLDHIPPGLHLVVAARAEPPLPIARLRARGQVTELRAADLRFTPDEAAAFLDHTMGLDLAADDVAMLESCTEGWVAGLQLAAVWLQGRDPAPLADIRAALTGTARYILDYLADEVFDRQPEDVRRFLLRTSVLDRLSASLCAALVGETDDAADSAEGQSMLERLDAASLFLVRLDEGGTWYRYHHLFAGFLRERLQRDIPELARELHRRASRWYEQAGLVAEAADHALAARDYGSAARLVERAIPATLWRRGELATLLRWLERLPSEAARGRPRLCLDLAWALLWSGRFEAVESRLRDAEDALDEAGQRRDTTDTHGRAMHGEIAAIRAELARQRGDLDDAIELARRALDDLPRDDQRVRGVTSGLLAGAYLWSGDAAAASRAYADAVAWSRAPESITLALIASGRLVLARAMEGRLPEATAAYRHAVELATAHDMADAPAIAVAEIGMGEVLREWNDLDAARDLLRRAIARCADAGGLAEMALDGCLVLARVLHASGEPDGALEALERAEAVGRDGHVARYAARVEVARARLWLTSSRADVAAAARWAREREGAGREGMRTGYVGLIERITVARLRIAEGRQGEAAAVLAPLLEVARAGGLTGCAIEILALQARGSLERGLTADAMLSLTRALSLGEPEGYVRTFLDEGPPMLALLRVARRRGVASSYVVTLLAAGERELGAAPPAAAALIDPLSARERELLRLLAAGLSTQEIAERLVITAGTVRNHLKSIYGKLDAHSRLQAVERARSLSLV